MFVSRLLICALLWTCLASCLSNDLTNGGSRWGLLSSPQLPHYLDSNPQSLWDKGLRENQTPETGVTRRYNWTVERAYKSPDGFNKSVIIINGQFPGPLLEANWGDTIEVTVTNKIDSQEEGISLHWHGLLQQKTPWFDGVPGVSQCPLAPGSQFVYTFQADQYGTSWYHSHYSGQYADGLFGPIVIYGPSPPDASYDVDLGPVMLEDYIYENYFFTLQQAFTPAPTGPIFFNTDNNLINGRGISNCTQIPKGTTCVPNSTTYSKFKFQPGKKHRLRLMNVGTASNQKFSIDKHSMTIVANDFVPVKPYHADVVTLGVGQRTDIIVTANGSPSDAVWMRSTIDFECLNTSATNTHGLAAVYYPKADYNALPKPSSIPTWPSNNCRTDPLNIIAPYYPQTPPANPSTAITLQIDLGLNKSNILEFTVNGTAFHTDYNKPTLWEVKDGQGKFFPERNAYNFGSNSSVRTLFINTASTQHPMHLHGHNYWILAEGRGTWDGKVLNTKNPPRRDTQMLQPGTPDNPSFIVVEWLQNNPGVWPFHCHMSLHMSYGLYINVVENPKKVQTDMDIPSVMRQTCVDWQAFTSKHLVDQIDSGV